MPHVLIYLETARGKLDITCGVLFNSSLNDLGQVLLPIVNES